MMKVHISQWQTTDGPTGEWKSGSETVLDEAVAAEGKKSVQDLSNHTV